MRKLWVLALALWAGPGRAEEFILLEPAASTDAVPAGQNENLGLEPGDHLEMESEESARAREKREKRALQVRGLEARARDARREGKIKEAERLEKKARRLAEKKL